MKRALVGLLLLILALLGLALARAVTLPSRQLEVPPLAPAPVDEAHVTRALAQAIAVPTISWAEPKRFDAASFEAFHALLATSFPRVHAELEHETLAGWSLLFTWPGRNATLPPILLTAHQDVVPVEPGTESSWRQPPFSGAVVDGEVWGRGAIDDKAGLITILEAVESLLARGFRPERTVLLFFGHDEEVGGKGALAMAERLARAGTRPYFLLDEWMPIAEGVVPGIEQPVALVRIAEKAYLTVELTAEAPGGHSSMPPPQTAVGILARAITRLEAAPLPARLEGPTRTMLEYLAPEAPFAQRLALGNLWLFGPLVRRQMAGSASSNAAIRTTTAPTVITGGIKDNVLPSRATALVNFRILPGDTVAGVLEHVRRTIDDPRVRATPQPGASDPAPASDVEAAPFQAIHRTLREVVPEALVAPALLVGTSDARHYGGVTDQIYGFRPIRLGAADLGRFHGTDERVAITDLVRSVRFFARLIETTAGASSP